MHGPPSPPPSRFSRRIHEGRAAFNGGAFFEAHEIWEGVWLAAADPLRTWVQGLIQLAAALHKLGEGKRAPCERLLRRALEKLDGAPDALESVDVAAARRHAERVLASLARGEDADPAAVQL